MLKPPHPAAVAGYVAAMLINPNNHAFDGGRATAAMEKEAVAALAKMFGFEGDGFLGHLTSSGTIANLEALWVARELHPDKPIVFANEAHYTHARSLGLLRAAYHVLPSTPEGTMDLGALEALAAKVQLGTVVVTLGSTALGALDPLPRVAEIAARRGFRIHVDAAYGGYFKLLEARDVSCAPFAATALADSLVVDPHKHGLQPYGCGCVLFRDGAVSRIYRHDSPYTYFSSADHHPGETTFECSRAGAAAAALWLTMRCLPLEGDGGMAAIVGRARHAAIRFAEAIAASPSFRLLLPPTLDIVVYLPEASTGKAVSAASARVFERAAAGSPPLHLAMLKVPRERFAALCPAIALDGDDDEITVLRSCLMRPEQLEWAPKIVELLERAAGE
jgi:glutamate/tyrosine decarboxylase-like PLP-dependent enzyme